MSRFKLISFDTCPYVERSRIVLFEKDQPFDQEFIDLSDKPDWFLDISPRGKVPVLLVDDRPIFESSVINELLEELVPQPALMPEDPIDRADARSWIEFNTQVVMAAHGKYLFSDDEEGRNEARHAYRQAFERIEKRLTDRDTGPYFLGEHFSLVDATYAPVFTRWQAMEQLGEAELLDGLKQVQSYRDALLDRPSVQNARGDNLTEKTVQMVQSRHN